MSGVMPTSDENVVRVETNVQYRVTDPQKYLFSVTSPDDSLRRSHLTARCVARHW